VASFLLAFPLISYIHSSSPHSCHMSFQSYPPLLDHSNYIWRRKQFMKLLIMQCSHQPEKRGMLGQTGRHERITHRQHGDRKGLLLFLRTKKINWKLSYGQDDGGIRVRFPAKADNFVFSAVSRSVLGPTHSIQWYQGLYTLESKLPGHEADLSNTSSGEINKEWSYVSGSLIHNSGLVINTWQYEC
jgi:hypothetical protein